MTRTYFSEHAPEFNLDIVTSGSDLLSRLSQYHGYDLAVIDARLSDRSGIDLLRQGKEQEGGLPPVIMLTELGEPESGDAFEDLHVADKIIKNAGYMDEVAYRIKAVLEHQKLITAQEAHKRVEEDLRIHQIELEMQNDELRLTKEELEASRAHYFELYDLAPVGFCTLSDSGMILEANLTLTSLLGMPRGSLLGIHFTAIILAEDQDAYYLHRQRMREGSLSGGVELRLTGRNNTPIWMHLEITPAAGDHGTVVYRVIARDTTELKRAENALRISEGFKLSILDSMRAEIAVVDRDGVILMVNASWRRFVAENPNAGAGMAFANIGSNYLEVCRLAFERDQDELALKSRQGIQAVLSGTLSEFTLEYPCHSPSRQRWFIMMVAPLGPDGKGAVISHTDITRQKIEEAQLRETQKMVAIGTLAGGIAHDFNNILTIILGNTEIVRTNAAADPLVMECLDDIHKAGTRAANLVGQILTFSRRRQTERKLLTLAPLVDETLRLLKATLLSRFQLEAHCDSGTPMVMADPIQIQQSLINLVTNSMQAMPLGPGCIRIHLEPIMVDAAFALAHPGLKGWYTEHQGPAAVLKVIDNGPGIDSTTKARVFEPFFTTKPVNEGTGLGLSVVQGIIQSHDGVIEVESWQGQGAAFSIYLPAAATISSAQAGVLQEASRTREPLGIAPPGKKDLHLLYLDDEPSIVNLFKHYMQAHGYRYTGFMQPIEAIEAVKKNPAAFDLVVTDFNMPGMNGLDVARELKKIRSNLPIAVTSGYIDETMIADLASIQIRDVIPKLNAAEGIRALLERVRMSEQEPH